MYLSGTADKWIDKDGNYLAVKIITPKKRNMNWTGLDKGEINSILVPEHPNIIKAQKLLMMNTDKQYFIVASENDIPEYCKNNLCIISVIYDWIVGKDLFEQVSRHQHKDSIHFAIQVSLDMCEALKHLHSHGFVYRDLKPENIMFRDQYKLVDLGMSKYIGESSTQTPCGTLEYTSPDLYGHHDKRIDIWTLGVLILDIAAPWTPADYPKQVDDKTIKNQQVYNFTLLTDKQRETYLRARLSKTFARLPELLDLSCSLLKKPDSRPSLEEIGNKLQEIQSKLIARNLEKTGEDITSRVVGQMCGFV